ncbi:family 16 glycosylhydrolase [Microbulbifer agarilyticus]|uniref:family 16 glycosylhydrolase n=1 Tax=Microbulbifer agarilyticus TaxID=260552 RepID=UPI001C97B061|nr:family 16 glycosylhydrolase [Microbulbifer agarilyticus]MBY6210352.1 family 16 glycosylhydrolase [Microbulbifer agarilyticus]
MHKTKIMRRTFKTLVLSSAIGAISSGAYAQQCQTPIFEDNFDQASLDTNAWDIMIGDGCSYGICGWGNSELQSYQAENITLNNGVMTIEARKERIRGSQYTSARIRTANMPGSGEWAFGRFEARMKFPDGQGMWPAFWMLPTDPVNGWPMSGEIDIFESVGQSANFAYGTIHYGQPWPDNSHQGNGIMMQPGKWSDDYHTYAIEWESHEIRWYVDNLLYSVKTPADVSPEDWPFDGRNKFHFLLNLAVGGSWGGEVDDSVMPQQLNVDYVRVYPGSQPALSGNHLPLPGSTETYSVLNGSGSPTWSVTGGTISGSGSSIQVTWDEASAATTQTLTVTSGGCEVSTGIYVGKNLSTETVLEDYDGNSQMSVSSATGTYSADNGVLTYTRDAGSQWDVLAHATSAIPDAGPFTLGDKAFQLDVNNTDPAMVGKEILIQLENSNVATPSNYPSGRHSGYRAYIEHANGWQTLRLQMADRIDGATTDSDVNALLVMVDPGNFTSDTYVLDNIVILGEGGTTPPGNNAPVAVFSESCTDLACTFDASASSDSDGSIAGYSWDFGDGNSDIGVTASNSYAAAGSYTVTLTVTDDQGASDTASKVVSVSDGSSGGEATSLVVSSVVTGTQDAGRGTKSGTATVTVLDDLGNPVSGATVTGDFSGTWSESASAVTDANGVATLVTSGTAKGGVTVNFCVSDVSGTLAFDPASSVNVCQ